MSRAIFNWAVGISEESELKPNTAAALNLTFADSWSSSTYDPLKEKLLSAAQKNNETAELADTAAQTESEDDSEAKDEDSDATFLIGIWSRIWPSHDSKMSGAASGWPEENNLEEKEKDQNVPTKANSEEADEDLFQINPKQNSEPSLSDPKPSSVFSHRRKSSGILRKLSLSRKRGMKSLGIVIPPHNSDSSTDYLSLKSPSVNRYMSLPIDTPGSQSFAFRQQKWDYIRHVDVLRCPGKTLLGHRSMDWAGTTWNRSTR